MRRAIGVIVVVSLAGACGSGSGGASEAGETETARGSGSESSAPVATTWLADLGEHMRLDYDVTLAGETTRVTLDVQEVVRHGEGVAVRLAPVGTPLGEEPIYPRWLVGESGQLASLEETAALTTEAGWVPIDEAGQLRTEAADNVEWRVPERWLTPGRAPLPGEEVSSGWSLTERVGDVSEPVAGHGCVRLERTDGGERTAILVCANVGLVQSTRTADDGSTAEQWMLVAIAAALEAGQETPL